MKRNFLVAGAAVLALGFSASVVSAQCAFERPQKAKKLQFEMVQAFVSCNNPSGNSANSMTEGGVPTCSPPETFNDQGGTPNDGWTWGPKSSVKGQFQSSKTKLVVSATPGNTSDVSIKLKCKDILNQSTFGANDQGTLQTVSRATLDDRALGDMTVIDFTVPFPVQMTEGKCKVKTSANVALVNQLSQPDLPNCVSIELVDVFLTDGLNQRFASMGLLNNLGKVPGSTP